MVHGLEEARAECRVNLHRASDDGSRELFVLHEQRDRMQTMSVGHTGRLAQRKLARLFGAILSAQDESF